MAVDFGHDLSCTTDLTSDMAEVDGTLQLGQALARRIITPRGGLIDDPNYGYDVRGFLNDDVTSRTLAEVQAKMDAEFLKDERVLQSSTTLSFTSGVLTTTTIIQTANGPFTLVLAISDVTVAILKPSR
jgi:hypothetical protein